MADLEGTAANNSSASNGVGPPLLRTQELSVSYSGVKALESVSLQVARGQVVGLIGPNGAGKTTCIDAISGFVSSSGRVQLAGQAIEQLPVHRRSRLGLARSFQSGELFDDLTVCENLLVASEHAGAGRLFRDLVAPRSIQPPARLTEVLEFLGLSDYAEAQPSSLPLGRQKLVSVARALVGNPSIVLLDEPAAGLDTTESIELGRRLRDLAEKDVGILLVDHDMGLVLRSCDYIYVLNFGQLIAQGTPDVIRHDQQVKEAYLGASTAYEDREHHARALSVVASADHSLSNHAIDANAGKGPKQSSEITPQGEPKEAGLLELDDISAGYGDITVLRNMSLMVGEREIVALLGANGAGKTTTLLAACGVIPVTKGEVRFAGRKVSAGRPWQAAQAGIAHIIAGHPVFSDLTVGENLRLGSRGSRPNLDPVLDYFPVLYAILDRKAGLLSGGEQQMLTLARGLLGSPKLLLLDEMSLGLAPVVVESLLPVLRRIVSDTGASVLLVEQHVGLALEIADRACVLNRGAIVLEGPSEDIARQALLLEESYLGEDAQPLAAEHS